MTSERDQFEDGLFWRARSPWVTALAWLVGLFYAVGSAGGCWYIAERLW